MAQILLSNGSAPATPGSGTMSLYADTLGDLHTVDAYGNNTNISGRNRIANGRLTLSSGSPVPTGDVGNMTSLYYTPFNGNEISLYEDSKWVTKTFSELSITGFSTVSMPYDLWASASATGNVALSSTVWTSASTRASTPVYQDGVLVNSVDSAKRYLGTIYVDSSGYIQDTAAKRFVWNYNNQIQGNLYYYSSASHTYSSTTSRPWNNDANAKVDIVVGLQYNSYINGYSYFSPSTSSASVDIALDSTSAGNALNLYLQTCTLKIHGSCVKTITPGYHYIQLLEKGNAVPASFYSAAIEMIWPY